MHISIFISVLAENVEILGLWLVAKKLTEALRSENVDIFLHGTEVPTIRIDVYGRILEVLLLGPLDFELSDVAAGDLFAGRAVPLGGESV